MKKFKLVIALDVILVALTVVLMILSYTVDKKFDYSFGISLGVTLVVIIFTCIYLICNKKGINTGYDERQMVARGQCYQAAFFTVVISSFIDGIIRMALDYDWSSYMVGVTTSMCIGVGVFCVMAILKDAYVAIEKSLLSMGRVLLFVGALNLFMGITDIVHDGFIIDGQVADSFINLIVGAMIIVIGVVCIIKNILNKRVEELE